MGRLYDVLDRYLLTPILMVIAFLISLLSWSILLIPIFTLYVYFYKKGILFSIAIPFTICLLIFIIYHRKFGKLEDKVSKIKRDYEKKESDLTKEYQNKNASLEYKYKTKNDELDRQRNRMNLILESRAPFRYSATLASDMESYVYDDMVSYLRKKRNPAIKASDAVKLMKEETKGFIVQYKEMLYKFEFLLKTFPELQKYVDDEEALQSLERTSSYSELTENTDHARDYLSDEEWRKLSVDERNQLALDRYKKRQKSNWKIGIEYEMYVDFFLRTKYHYNTIPYGSLKGLNDLGRDIIASHTDASGVILVYIIQCKYWASSKEIHENVVCQIFGTAMEYQLKRNLFREKVIPVIATTTTLSDMAQKFAQKLGVQVWEIPKGEYPMIKCNIGTTGEKIYHLPFDQQYYRTQIKKPGEFYAWTVKEAVSKGFRRALRHIIE